MSKRAKKLQEEIRIFVRQYGRKSQGGSAEPNDRRYDRKVEALVKRMRPEKSDAILYKADDAQSE